MIVLMTVFRDVTPFHLYPFTKLYITSNKTEENFTVYRTGNVHPPGHPQTAAVLRDAIKGTFCNGKKR